VGGLFRYFFIVASWRGWMSHKERKYMRRVLRGLETNRDLEGVDISNNVGDRACV
jgi:hypothetical protein